MIRYTVYLLTGQPKNSIEISNTNFIFRHFSIKMTLLSSVDTDDTIWCDDFKLSKISVTKLHIQHLLQTLCQILRCTEFYRFVYRTVYWSFRNREDQSTIMSTSIFTSFFRCYLCYVNDGNLDFLETFSFPGTFVLHWYLFNSKIIWNVLKISRLHHNSSYISS